MSRRLGFFGGKVGYSRYRLFYLFHQMRSQKEQEDPCQFLLYCTYTDKAIEIYNHIMQKICWCAVCATSVVSGALFHSLCG